jgi:hypothetical protein
LGGFKREKETIHNDGKIVHDDGGVPNGGEEVSSDEAELSNEVSEPIDTNVTMTGQDADRICQGVKSLPVGDVERGGPRLSLLVKLPELVTDHNDAGDARMREVKSTGDMGGHRSVPTRPSIASLLTAIPCGCY